MPRLLDLPPEILACILLSLQLRDVISCKETCRELYDIISSSVQIAYHIQLQIAGMLDNPYYSLPTPTRLEMLKDREEAWGSFKPKFIKNIKLPSESSGLYDVTPGIYLYGKDEEPGRRYTLSIQAIRLPQKENEESMWESIDFGRRVIDFATLIEQEDLLAAVILTKLEGTPNSRLSVVLRRYSTHQLYDGISNTELFLDDVPDAHGRPIVSIELAGENLVVVPEFPDDNVTDRPRSMYVYNWRTGKRISDPISVDNSGLVFLREDIFVNPSMHNGTINVYHISPDGVNLIQQLRFPTLQSDHIISFIACRGDPSPTAKDAFPRYTPQQLPYVNNPEDAIIIFALQTQHFRATNPLLADHFFMFVHRRSLLSLIPHHILDSHSSPSPPETVPWESWGPPITRWLPAESWSMNFITLSAGQRFIYLHPPYINEDDYNADEEDDFPPVFSLLDFNPWNVKRFQESGEEHLSTTMLRSVFGVRNPSAEEANEQSPSDELPDNICPGEDSFTQDIVSRLPYVRYSSIGEFDVMEHDAVLIDQERLIGLKASDIGSFDSLDVMYFG